MVLLWSDQVGTELVILRTTSVKLTYMCGIHFPSTENNSITRRIHKTLVMARVNALPSQRDQRTLRYLPVVLQRKKQNKTGVVSEGRE